MCEKILAPAFEIVCCCCNLKELTDWRENLCRVREDNACTLDFDGSSSDSSLLFNTIKVEDEDWCENSLLENESLCILENVLTLESWWWMNEDERN